MNRSLRICLGVAISMLVAQSAFAISYEAILLKVTGPLGDKGRDINNHGQAIGVARYINSERPLLYDGTLDFLDDGTGTVWDINDAGHVIGSSFFQTFLFDGTSRTILDFSAAAISNSGYMTGTAGAHACLYDGVIHDLGTLGGTFSRGVDVNIFGHVAGESYLAGNSDRHAFLYDGVTMKDIGTLDGKTTVPAAINDLGHVVGTSLVGESSKHGFFYDGTTMHDLGDFVEPIDVNNRGQVLVRYGIDFFLWTEATGMLSINEMLGPAFTQSRILELTEINDSGQMVGTIYQDFVSNRERMAILNPIPEPAAMVVALSGLLLIAAVSRRSP